MSLSTPHQYDVTHYVKSGRKNEIVVCVYNGIEHVGVGQDSHSVTDQTQGNWNGITGRIELRTVYQPTIRIFPNAAQHKAVIVIDGRSMRCHWAILSDGGVNLVPISILVQSLIMVTPTRLPLVFVK